MKKEFILQKIFKMRKKQILLILFSENIYKHFSLKIAHFCFCRESKMLEAEDTYHLEKLRLVLDYIIIDYELWSFHKLRIELKIEKH